METITVQQLTKDDFVGWFLITAMCEHTKPNLTTSLPEWEKIIYDKTLEAKLVINGVEIPVISTLERLYESYQALAAKEAKELLMSQMQDVLDVFDRIKTDAETILQDQIRKKYPDVNFRTYD